MHLKVALLIVTFVAIGPINASFWDSIPVVAHLKALIQILFGDPKGAKITQDNFTNQMPVVSQIKSMVHVVKGDLEEAKRTQERFLHGFIEPAMDNTPIVGHIKGTIHIATGDVERGEQIIKGATSATAAVGGALVGGPVGAIGAVAATDGVFTGVESAFAKEYKPSGMVDYVSRIDQHSPGEHFDTLLGVGLEFAGGMAAQKGSAKNKPVAKVVYDSTQEIKKKPYNNRDPKNVPLLESESPNLSTQQRHNDKPSSNKVVYGSGHAPGVQPLRGLFSDDMPLLEIAPPGSSNWERLMRVPAAFRDLNIRFFMKWARRTSGVPKEWAKNLEPIDFRLVNDVRGTTNCFLCPLAAMTHQSVSQLMRKLGITDEVHGVPHVDHIVDLYKRAGYEGAEKIFVGSYHEFHGFWHNNIQNGERVRFTMPYSIRTATGTAGHVVSAQVWRTGDGTLRLLITDFQQPPNGGRRFATDLLDNVETVSVIVVK